MSTLRLSVFSSRRLFLALPVLALGILTAAPLGRAQNQPQQPAPPPQDQTAPDAGGPGADSGAIALPKKKDKPDDTPPPAPAAPKIKNPEG